MDYEKQGCVHDIFARQAKLTPNNVAIVTTTGRQISYSELDDVTDILATNLRTKGVKPDSIVGIYMDKVEQAFPISVISVLKAGGAFFHLAFLSDEKSKLEAIEECRCVAVITMPKYKDTLMKLKDIAIISLGDEWETRLKEDNLNQQKLGIPPKVHLDNLAFIVYSSGTTGKPKGTMYPHRGIVHSYYCRLELYPYESDDRIACNIYFVWEFLRPLTKGLTMYMIPGNVLYDPARLAIYLHRNEITRILLTPSCLANILANDDADAKTGLRSLNKLRLIILNGEVVTVDLIGRLRAVLPWVRVSNLYSLAETHDVSASELNEGYLDNAQNEAEVRQFFPVGKPLPHVHMLIMDEDHNIQPTGKTGEIYIASPGLARCYINRPEEERKRFISRPSSLPSSIGDRLFRTGDWGYALKDGSTVIGGRCDCRVKIRGLTIDLQGMETALLKLPVVKACVAVCCGVEGGDKYTVAYVVPNGVPSSAEIQTLLKPMVPDYLRPHYVVFIKSLPTHPRTSKLDRKSLPPFDPKSQPDVKIDYSCFDHNMYFGTS